MNRLLAAMGLVARVERGTTTQLTVTLATPRGEVTLGAASD